MRFHGTVMVLSTSSRRSGVIFLSERVIDRSARARPMQTGMSDDVASMNNDSDSWLLVGNAGTDAGTDLSSTTKTD